MYAAIESMNGARFVHDQLELAGWQVEIADAQKVKGLAPLACKTDKIDAFALSRKCYSLLHPSPLRVLIVAAICLCVAVGGERGTARGHSTPGFRRATVNKAKEATPSVAMVRAMFVQRWLDWRTALICGFRLASYLMRNNPRKSLQCPAHVCALLSSS